MGLGLGLGLGIGRRLKGAGQYLLDAFTGAAAAYSLRKLSVNTTNVIRVRRDADNGERDFTAQEIEDGTLENWVNGIVEDLPLDTESSAAAAYSLRNLSSTYSGAVVRVRRSSDNAEADFTATEVSNGTLEAWVGKQNLFFQSEAFDEPVWGDVNLTITPNAAVAPDGTNTAELITKTSGINTVARIFDINVYKNTGIHTLSIHVKKNTASTALLRLDASGNTCNATFTFDTKTFSNFGANFISSSYEELANDWFRLTLTGNVTSTSWAPDIINLFPEDINASLYAWGAQLEEGATANTYIKTTIGQSGYGYVTTWYDQSSNNNHATQGSASSQPKIVDAGTLVTENGKAAVDFDGVDDQLTSTFGTTYNQPTYSFFTHNFTSVPSAFDGVIGSIGGEHRLITSSVLNYTIQAGGSLQYNSYSTDQSLVSYKMQSTDPKFFFNGTQQSVSGGTSIGTTGVQGIILGGITSGSISGNAPIQIQEFVIYDSDQSSNRINIEGNINTYYNIYTPIVSDGLVTTWYDQSGNGNDATQGSASAQPKIVSAGVLVTENGKPAVDFDGVNDYLKADSLAASFSGEDLEISRMIVLKPNVLPSTYSYFFGLGNGSSFAPLRTLALLSSGNLETLYRDNLVFAKATNYPSYTTTQLLLQEYNSGTSTNVYNNTTNILSNFDVNVGTVTLNKATIGALERTSVDYYFNGTIQEIAVYSSDQSTNRSGIEANINKAFNIYWDGTQKGLLDTYTGAEAAYSLRALNSAYTGAILRVRRDSDNAEQDIYAKWDGTLNVEALETFCAATDGYVVTWYDQSGNANNATQATAASQPQIVSSGSIITDSGYQVIQYDGSDDNLVTSFTATGTMLMGGADGGAFYEISRSGAYSLLASASLTDHPLKESIRVIWGRTLSAGEQSAIESRVTYSDWDFSDVTNFTQYWRLRGELTSFPLIDTSNGTNFLSAWVNCTSLTSFPLLDVSNGTNFQNAWYICTSLTSFPLLDVSNGTNFSYAWYNCTSLTSFPLLDVSNGTSFISTWRLCVSLTSFPLLDVSSGTNFSSSWLGCSSLEDFPANMFDSVTATNFGSAFTSTNLTQTSIDNILVSIDTAGQSGGTFDQSGGSAPSAVGEAAIDSLIAKGWTITVTGIYDTLGAFLYRVETDGGIVEDEANLRQELTDLNI